MTEQTILSGELQLKAAIIAPEHPQAAIVFVHGMAEHKERYYPFMNYLCELGFACVIYDQRGRPLHNSVQLIRGDRCVFRI